METKNMRLCIISKHSPFETGGVEEVVRQHIKILSKFKWNKMTVFYMTYNKNEQCRIIKKDNTIIEYHPIWVPKLKIIDITLYNLIAGALAYFGQYTIVHSHAECGFGYALFTYILGKNSKWIHTYHGVWFRVIHNHLSVTKSPIKRLALKIANFILSTYERVPGHISDVITVVSDSVKRDILEHYLIRKKYITVLPNSFDDTFLREYTRRREKIKYKNNTPCVLYIGRDIHTKGFDIVLKILSKIKKEYNQKILLLALVGTHNRDIKIPPVLRNNVILMEYVPKEEMIDIYSTCDILLFPSRYDSFGIVGLEAIATGMPIIVSNRVGFADMYLTKLPVVELNNIDKWAKFTINLIHNKKSTRKLLLFNKKCILNKFSQRSVRRKLEYIYILVAHGGEI